MIECMLAEALSPVVGGGGVMYGIIVTGALALGAALGATGLATAGLGVAAAGAATTYTGQRRQADASRRAEQIRERAMKVEADRARRDALRTSMRERGIANAAATNQGADAGSGVQGGFSQIQSNAGYRVGAINTNEFFGEQLFRANDAFARGGQTAAIGTGLSRVGSALFTNSGKLGAMLQQPEALDPTWSTTYRPPSHWGG
jgi:hypothetical protein